MRQHPSLLARRFGPLIRNSDFNALRRIGTPCGSSSTAAPEAASSAEPATLKDETAPAAWGSSTDCGRLPNAPAFSRRLVPIVEEPAQVRGTAVGGAALGRRPREHVCAVGCNAPLGGAIGS